MTVRDDVSVNFEISPRLITVAAPSTEIVIQDLHDTLTAIEDSVEGSEFPNLVSSAGKEALGGGVTVGITTTLLNAKLAFEARTTPDEEGTITTGSTSLVVTDSAATFQTNGITPGASFINHTTKASGTVLTVDSETQLTLQQLSGGSRSDTQVADVYAVHNVIQCSVSGGNLVAVDDLEAEIDSIFPTAFTQVVRTSSSSATLQELQDIQFSSFGGGVWINTVDGSTGTVFPTGTERQPVDNFTDGLTIASTRGFNTFYVRSDATIDSGLDYTDYVFVGQGPNLTDFTVTAAANVTNCTFRNAKVTGTLDGDSHIEECIVEAINFVSGVIENCILNPSTILLGGSQVAHFIDCESGVPGTGTPVIDCGGSGQALAVRNYSGGIKLINKTGSDAVSIDLLSGQVRIDLTTVTAGTIVVRGTGKVVDDSNDDWLPSGTYGGMTLVNETVHGQMMQDIWTLMGLDKDNPLTVTQSSRVAGNINQVITGDGETTSTVTRQ